MRRLVLLMIAVTLLGTNARAQEDTSALAERLERLERDVNFVQKQVYRNGSTTSGDETTTRSAPTNTGQLQVRIAQIDEEIRQIRGLIEQSQFQNRQLATELKKLSDDSDFRFRALEQRQASLDAAPAVPTPGPLADPALLNEPATANVAAGASEPVEAKKPASAPASAAPAKEKPALTGNDFPNANAHYSYAFKLLNEKKFSEAAASFDGFVKKYPADPLTANAFYWLGESQYARSDFTRSAESFRKGFEVNTQGQKAPDNLYKLALSLAQIKRKAEACIVLAQITTKYSETAARTAAKAKEAATGLQCK